MTTSHPAAIGLPSALIGTLVAVVLGFLTFGVQATVAPDHLPLAVAVPDGPAGDTLAPVVAQLTAQGGDAVAWRSAATGEAARLLDDKEVYGVLEITPIDGGRGLTATAVVSGALNPSGTAAAQQVLTTAGGGLLDAVAERGVDVAPLTVETLHPTSAAGKVFPLAASALLWIATLVASALPVVLAARAGRRLSSGSRLVTAAAAGVLAPAVVIGFGWLWDAELTVGWSAVGFLVLVAAAFATVQSAVLRLLGLAGAPVLAVLYLTAPSVAAQAPELLAPAYRALLWSWTPFRFSSETLRSLLFLDASAPGVGVGVLVFALLAAGGLAVLLWPSRTSAPAPALEPATPRALVP